jgi:hypothetical protein
MDTIETIRGWAGPQRALTFELVAKACLAHALKRYVETGCYRGTASDGQSTIILGMLAQQCGGGVVSFDTYQGAVDKARALTAGYPVTVTCMDSVNGIRSVNFPIDVLYLDSYDYEEANPGPCQAHQLLETAAAIPKMSEKSIIFLDDCDLPNGGKAKLADVLIRAMGWTRWMPDAQLYQNVYCRGIEL